jgi:hypothetical protein
VRGIPLALDTTAQVASLTGLDCGDVGEEEEEEERVADLGDSFEFAFATVFKFVNGDEEEEDAETAEGVIAFDEQLEDDNEDEEEDEDAGDSIVDDELKGNCIKFFDAAEGDDNVRRLGFISSFSSTNRLVDI